MKLAALLVPVVLISVAVAGCAEPSGDDAVSESNVTAQTARVDGIAACAGRKVCLDTFVVKTLLSSSLRLTEMFQDKEPLSLASEHFVSWMQPSGETYSTFRIETKPLGNGKYTVTIGLGNADLGANSTESGCRFAFTIDHDVIVESEVAASCAG